MADDNFMMKRIPATAVTPYGNGAPFAGQRTMTRDEADLTHYGKRQQFKRNFRMISIIGLTCTLMITWEGVLVVFQGGFMNGGPAGLVYGYLFAWFGCLSQALVMAELGSMIPLAGGPYNWVAILAPPSMTKFLSYITGWITVIGWQAVTAGSTLNAANMITGLAVLHFPEYTRQRWQGTLIYYALVLICLFFNTYLGRLLPQVEAIILAIHICGFFAILIPLVYLAPKDITADQVFTVFFNQGDWATQGLSFFVGSVTTMFAFIGIDGATHMAEEIENAAIVIPRSMIITVMINGTLGFAMLIATLFSVGNFQKALDSPTGFPFIQIFEDATRSVGGTTAMVIIIIAICIFSLIGTLATASRMLWAFARENGIPGSKYISRVDTRSGLPLWSIGTTTVIITLLALINIGSSTVFNALTGLTIAAFYSSFLIAAVVMLHKRLTTPDSDFRWGPFKLGRFGVPVYIVSIIYSVIGGFFSFFPPSSKVDPVSMNWSIAVFGGVLIISIIHWFAYARNVYTGPIVEIRPVVDVSAETLQKEE